MITLKGEKITLEPLEIEKHGEGYFEVSQDENLHRYTGNTVPKDLAEVRALLGKYEQYFLNWMIVANDTQKVIGILRLGKPGMENGKLVAGESQFLASRYWRKGHMKEAKKLFYHHVFEELAVDILYADVWAENVNSVKSLESYGYRLVETKREIFPKTGECAEKRVYALSRQDYQLNK